MKRLAIFSVVALLGAVFVANAPPAGAADISLESRTYMPARGTDDYTHALLYEYLTLDVERLKPGLYLRAAGWGRSDLADTTFDSTTNGELQYAFLGWRGAQNNTEARLGRVSLTAGVARNEVFDGVLFGSDLPGGLDVTLFGGVPVETDDGGRTDDTLYGARVSQGNAGRYRVGVSYLKQENAGSASREEAGVDVFVVPVPSVELAGSSLYNAIAEDWARHDYRLALGPYFERVRLAGTWSSTAYGIYFQSTVHPVFELEDEDKGEKLDKLGGELEVELGLGFMLSGGYTSYDYEISGQARAYGVGLAWDGEEVSVGGEFRNMQGDDAENRYQLFGVYATQSFEKFLVSAAVEYQAFEEAINGADSATNATLGASHQLREDLEISASGEYATTPEYEREVKVMFAVIWRYGAAFEKGGIQ